MSFLFRPIPPEFWQIFFLVFCLLVVLVVEYLYWKKIERVKTLQYCFKLTVCWILYKPYKWANEFCEWYHRYAEMCWHGCESCFALPCRLRGEKLKRDSTIYARRKFFNVVTSNRNIQR